MLARPKQGLERSENPSLPAEHEIPAEGVVRRAFEAEKRRESNPRCVENWYFDSRLRAIEKGLVPGSVLDVGCAEGLFSAYLAEAGWSVTALDLHAEFIQYLARKAELALLPVQCVQGDALRLPLTTGAYDNILLGEILEHLADPGAMLREAGRVLGHGGRLILTTPLFPRSAERSFNQWVAIREATDTQDAGDNRPDTHVFEFTPDELRSLIEEMGFELLSFTFLDTRLWEGRLGRVKEQIPFPACFFSLIDRALILLNSLVGSSRLPGPLRIRHLVAVLGCKMDG